jgi:hypothetical protein
MPTFSQLAKGMRARRRVKLPLPGAHVDTQTGEWVGPTDELDVRPLRSDEYAEVLAGARRYAVEHGLAEPTDEDELYQRGRQLHTLAIACLDRDSPVDTPRPYFDGGVKQIDASDLLTPEVLAYLERQQELVQDESNPLLKSVSPAEFMDVVARVAEGDLGFFVNSRPGTLWIFMRTLASLHLNARTRSAQSSSSPEPH